MQSSQGLEFLTPIGAPTQASSPSRRASISHKSDSDVPQDTVTLPSAAIAEVKVRNRPNVSHTTQTPNLSVPGFTKVCLIAIGDGLGSSSIVLTSESHAALTIRYFSTRPSTSQLETNDKRSIDSTDSSLANRTGKKLHGPVLERDPKRGSGTTNSVSERVHEAEYATLCSPTEPDHKLAVTLENDEFSEENFLVYDNYQKVVHHEDEKGRSRSDFKRFLCDSPLRRQSTKDPDERERLIGSYHQCYRIDGKLVAVGVIDLLLNCVSSMYFLYHEIIQKFSPGKLGALFEISLASERGYHWWYPGFYIHNCAKMRYKIDYAPQFILDPQVLQWDPLCKKTLKLLDEKAFVSLALERQSAETRSEGPETSHCLSQPADSSEPKATAAIAQVNDNNHDAGEDDDASDASYSLFRSNMPGIPSLREMKQVDLSSIALRISPELPLFRTSDLSCWEASNVTDASSIKGFVAELVAAVGPDLIDSICLELQAQA